MHPKKIKIDQPQASTTTSETVTDEISSSTNLRHQVRHDVALPTGTGTGTSSTGFTYIPLGEEQPPDQPARTYPFTLDPFQRLSIACLERKESVLVSAHTSAGKTVIAEYAIAMSLRDRQRVIYTSPIKALSNQKFRELQAEFKDVGLMTGDISINPTASCLVMTTEILRSMLYKGSEVLREVAWVVFDEVHYMRDKERGVVWEETLILLPDTVKFVFLSATIPNAKQFAQWICKIHNQPCHVVYTDYRPTPLQHYLFAAGGDGVHLAVDEKGLFREDNFQKAISVLIDFDPNEAALGKAALAKRRAPKKDPKALSNDLLNIVKLIQAKQNLPVIVFSFSKKDCEAHAIKLSKMDFNPSEEEKALVDTVFCNAIESLPLEDRTLPQITSILPLLKRGVGIHHSGLLPILKEIIEILFQEGLIKILFATETFSIGLNMPAKTVVFTSVRKFDGKTFRWISGGEYIQMSGRAGRRGLDDRGIVILMLDEKMEPAVAKGMLKGQADPLNSAFYLSYNMILNLMRVEGIAPESMLAKSFFQFQNNSTLPTLEAEVKMLNEQLASNCTAFDSQLEEQLLEYSNVAEALAECEGALRKIQHHPSIILPFIQPGRLIWVREEGLESKVKDFGWGSVVGLAKKGGGSSKEDPLIEVLLHVKASSPIPIPKSSDDAKEKGEMRIVPIRPAAIFQTSSIRIHLPRSADLCSEETRNQVLLSLFEVKKRLAGQIPLLCPVKDLGIKDETFSKLTIKQQLLTKRLEALTTEQLTANLPAYQEKLAIQRSLKAVRRRIQEMTAITHMEELKCRKRILRRLNYLTEEGVIELKGRVACEIGTGDELMLTELMFNGAFNGLSVEHTVAFLSAFVCEEKSNTSANAEANANSTLREELGIPMKMLQETAIRISKISQESALPGFDSEAYMAKFRFELMDVVWAWSRGAKFWQVCKMTSVFEGNIIRCMKRLEELLRQMCQAAKSIGNSELECKFSEGITKIKRDIVFANSLYL
jgi:ATP-dependent RNA helicase DOB1